MDLLSLLGRLRRGCGVFACVYYLTRRYQRPLTPYCCPRDGALWPPRLRGPRQFWPPTAVPTCSKAMCWSGAFCTVNFTGSAEPSLQYGSVPFRFFFAFWYLTQVPGDDAPFYFGLGLYSEPDYPKIWFQFSRRSPSHSNFVLWTPSRQSV